DLGEMFGFGDIFGGAGGASGRGRDAQAEVTITFAEMIGGVKKTVTLPLQAKCEKCGGTGGAPGAKEETCRTCGGRGRVNKQIKTMFGAIARSGTCPDCAGRGKTFSQKCPDCGGAGRLKRKVSVEVDIPPGIGDGQTIVVSGKGEAGVGGAPAGDLLLTVRVSPAEGFERRGDNILTRRHISFAQAALGDKIEVKTPEGGTVKMKVPAGTQPGEIFRVRGRGVPRLRGFGRGDLLVEILVDVPTKLSRSQKELIKQLRDLSG
ncbi:MAG TPA: molecular chaperone DnaJ, partial [Candidatus Moranbacteria bacterium]|nr:molecular chaperone DnaJ [Candidatus Moranbacteria bacterium]